MQFPQSFIEQLKAHFSVSDVVGRVVTLRHHGREFQGLCPFHKEKSPSFTVNDEKGFYHCFGYSAHGDQIGFLMQYEALSYPDAIARLAEMAGVAVPKPSPELYRKEEKRKGLQDIVEMAAQWFEAQLALPVGGPAVSYLQQRGIRPETIQQFRLGFAPDHRSALLEMLYKDGVTPAQAVEAGLAIQPEDGRAAYSRFRGRLMFPISDRSAKVVGFGGRVLPQIASADAPKYLNSPDGELFHKGQLLYNHHHARKAAADKKRVIICEGYMDVIALSQAGFAEAVAPLGTALTETQLQMTWKLCDHPLLCLDADEAGKRAMRRACELALPLLQPEKSLRFVALPAGEDPDSFVMRYGQAAMEEMIAKAEGIAERLWHEVAATSGASPEAKAAQEHRLMGLADKIAHPTVRAHFRRYMKEKCWPQKWKAAGTTAMAKTDKAQLGSTLPLSYQQQMGHAALQCLMLVMLYPRLMHEAMIEEIIGQLMIADRIIAQIQQWLVQSVTTHPDYDRVQLQQNLRLHPFAEEMSVLIQRAEREIPKALYQDTAMEQTELARQIFQRLAFNAYLTAQVQLGREQAQREGACGLNEETQARITPLNQQLQQLSRERESLYLEEWLSEA